MTDTQLPEADPRPVDPAWLAKLHNVRSVETDSMPVARQPTAADRIRTLLADGDLKAGRNELSERDIADVHSVLARHADMERRLADLRVEWSPRTSIFIVGLLVDTSFSSKETALRVAGERHFDQADDGEVAWRLVGRWRDADEYQAEEQP